MSLQTHDPADTITLDGIVYSLDAYGNYVVVPPKPSRAAKKPAKANKKSPTKATEPLRLQLGALGGIWLFVRMLISVRGMIVIGLPIIILIVIKMLQLNVSELGSVVSKWFGAGHLNWYRAAALGILLALVLGWVLETIIINQSKNRKQPKQFWWLMGGRLGLATIALAAGTLVALAGVGVAVWLCMALYASLPVLCVFLVFGVGLIVALAASRIVLLYRRHVMALVDTITDDKWLLYPKKTTAKASRQWSVMLRRIGVSLLAHIAIVMLIAVQVVVYLQIASSLEQAILVGACILLGLLILCFDHWRALQTWHKAHTTALASLAVYPRRALALLLFDVVVLIIVVLALIAQVIVPNLLVKAHTQAAGLQKILPSGERLIPSARDAGAFDKWLKSR